MLKEAGIDKVEAHQIGESVKKLVNLNNLGIGQEITVSFKGGDKESVRLASLKIAEPDRDIEVIKDDQGNFLTKEIHKNLKKKLIRSANIIDNSLFQAGMESGVPANMMLELIKAYSYDVDFQRDIKNGDRFEIMYEILADSKGKRVRDGNLLYAMLTVDGKELKIYRHTTKSGVNDYFTADGKSVKKSLLRTPINGARITSKFGMRRHPIMGYSKMHRGIDFGAPIGTPIFAAGDGTVDFMGTKNGYGNYMKLRHNSEYSTAYAHISRFAKNMRKGKRVKQGEVIAYVGNTGRSTGPHLHYETVVRGAQVNPLSVKSAPGVKLAGSKLDNFNKEKKAIDYLFASLPINNAQIASK